MKRIIATAIMAMLLSLGIASAQEKNNKVIYVINNHVVSDFDGSQLVNKTIASYKVDAGSNVHMIITSDYAEANKDCRTQVVTKDGKVTIVSIDDKGNYTGSVVTRPGTLYVIDGKISSTEEFVSIFPSNIESMAIIKSKDNPDFKKFAKEDTEVVMMITTKK